TAVSIKIIRTTIKGVANARMMGLNAASGKYIIFLDADDVYDSVLVDKYVEQIKKNETDIEFFNFFGSNTRYLDTSSLDLKTSRKLLVDVLLSKISAHSFSYISKRDIWLNSDFNNEMV
ncbi:glycosyltransferase family 2 protein, partial [Weissella cibaria]|uniref:glycosyltransferase family 2 protein n=1 Tax=Weissella cibaria TaxID=137591 RepID=UPI00215A46D8